MRVGPSVTAGVWVGEINRNVESTLQFVSQCGNMGPEVQVNFW